MAIAKYNVRISNNNNNTGCPQLQQTLQTERDPTIVMAIVARRQQHSSGSQTGNQHAVANGLDRGRVDVVVDVIY